MKKSILFVRPPSGDEPPETAPAPKSPADVLKARFPLCILPPLEVPEHLAGKEADKLRYQIALHECGHALGAILVSREVELLQVSPLGGGRGGAQTASASGYDEAVVCLAGAAAESLLDGIDHAILIHGSTTDRENARRALLDAGAYESDVDDELGRIFRELQTLFADVFVNGLRTCAEKLAHARILSGVDAVELLAHGQKSAVLSGSLAKSLAGSLNLSAGLSALAEVQRLHAQVVNARTPQAAVMAEVARNHADMRSATLGGLK